MVFLATDNEDRTEVFLRTNDSLIMLSLIHFDLTQLMDTTMYHLNIHFVHNKSTNIKSNIQ